MFLLFYIFTQFIRCCKLNHFKSNLIILFWESQLTKMLFKLLLLRQKLECMSFQAITTELGSNPSDWSDSGCYTFSNWSELQFLLNRQSKLRKVPRKVPFLDCLTLSHEFKNILADLPGWVFLIDHYFRMYRLIVSMAKHHACHVTHHSHNSTVWQMHRFYLVFTFLFKIFTNVFTISWNIWYSNS